ncbi:MAG: YncE family protein [Tidjanibacter sp.]|nr:YncE family protein [Tidjanibacter sp.]
MKKFWTFLTLMASVFALSSCGGNSNDDPEDFTLSTDAVYIINEGNWGSANASLSSYNPATKVVGNNLFRRSNSVPLGDLAQSSAVYGDDLYIVVNNSGVVFRVDRQSMKIQGKIDGLTSPRFIALVSDTKGYISNMYTNQINIFNPSTCEIIGSITLPEEASSDQMAVIGGKLYVAWWSYGKKIYEIDTKTDKVVGEIEVGLQPWSVVVDNAGKLWVLSDGGCYPENPAGYEAPKLMRINPATKTIERTFTFTEGDYFSSRLALNGAADTLYYTVGGKVWRMAVSDNVLPSEPLLNEGVYYYSMAVDPVSGELYVGDAGDYVNSGSVSRYTAKGELVDSFSVGIAPGSIVFGTSKVE